MSLDYRKITYDDSMPATNQNGDIWIKAVGDSYQAYLYFTGSWNPIMSGGIFKTETNPDDHYYNIYVQNSMPTISKNGYFWLKTTTMQLYIYLNGFVLLSGA